MSQSGDPCLKCSGRLQVVNTKVAGDSRIRYLGCRACGHRPADNIIVIPLEYAPPRKSQLGATSSTDFPGIGEMPGTIQE